MQPSVSASDAPRHLNTAPQSNAGDGEDEVMPSEEEDESEDENLDEDALLDASVRHAFQCHVKGEDLR